VSEGSLLVVLDQLAEVRVYDTQQISFILHQSPQPVDDRVWLPRRLRDDGVAEGAVAGDGTSLFLRGCVYTHVASDLT
jgi:hypothetical protein